MDTNVIKECLVPNAQSGVVSFERPQGLRIFAPKVLMTTQAADNVGADRCYSARSLLSGKFLLPLQRAIGL
jgi:hypothetical protein